MVVCIQEVQCFFGMYNVSVVVPEDVNMIREHPFNNCGGELVGNLKTNFDSLSFAYAKHMQNNSPPSPQACKNISPLPSNSYFIYQNLIVFHENSLFMTLFCLPVKHEKNSTPFLGLTKSTPPTAAKQIHTLKCSCPPPISLQY